MSDATSLLYDLPGFKVVSVAEASEGLRRVVIMQVAVEHACPRCGVLVGWKPFDVRESGVKDLPMGHRRVEVIWRKRRYRCREVACAQRVFVERSVQIPPRYRLTGRLRVRLESASSVSARALSDVAAEYGVSWWSVQRALIVAAAAKTPGTLSAVRRLGLDETRARSLRWAFDPDIGKWRLSDPWMTSFVDLDTGARVSAGADPGPLGRRGHRLAQHPGSGVAGWCRGRRPGPVGAVRRRDPPAAAPHDDRGGQFPFGALSESGAHRGAAASRPRPARTARPQGRPGVGAPPAAPHRREPAVPPRSGPPVRGAGRDDPTNEIGAAWGIEELLRQLLACTDAHLARRALFTFYDAVLIADMPETTRLAQTIQTWWPEIQAFLRLRVTNARTEGTNRVIKQIKRTGCGYRNQANYERRIVLHVAASSAA